MHGAMLQPPLLCVGHCPAFSFQFLSFHFFCRALPEQLRYLRSPAAGREGAARPSTRRCPGRRSPSWLRTAPAGAGQVSRDPRASAQPFPTLAVSPRGLSPRRMSFCPSQPGSSVLPQHPQTSAGKGAARIAGFLLQGSP